MISFLKKVLTGLRPVRYRSASKTLAVLGYFDKKTEEMICDIKKRTELSICELGEAVYSAPHITFLITDDRGIDKMKKRLDGIARKIPLPVVRFSHIGYFPSSGVVFIGITPTTELMRFHTVICSKFEGTDSRISPYYMPSKWIPHCSIADGVEEISIKTSVYREIPFPFEARIERLAITEMDHSTGKLVNSVDIQEKVFPDQD